jgi:hypothetical protein
VKILKVSAGVLLLIVLAGALAWLFRSDPLGPIAGKELSGPEVAYPADWEFSNDSMTIAVESNPRAPHSVTTICFLHEGQLYVPARDGSSKTWPQYVLTDPQVRLKIGGSVYLARADRVEDADMETIFQSAVEKYRSRASELEGQSFEDVWLFRISRR